MTVGAPIEPSKQRLLTDEQWLAVMARYAGDWTSDTSDGEIIGGAIQLSRGLEPLVREDPERFSNLANRMGADLHPAYFGAVLRGLTHEEGSVRSGSLDQVCAVLRRIADIGAPVSERTLADAIGALADEAIPDDIVGMLRSVAESADPEADTWPTDVPSDSMNGPATQGINSARGAAARSVARLLFADRDRWDALKPTVERLVTDPVLAVRSVAVECLLAVLDTHRDEALAGFERLAEGADSILGSGYVERFIHYAMYRDYPAMRATLVRMLHSPEQATVQAGARQMALAALSMDEARDDADIVLGMGEDARAAAARIYADNVADETVGADCEERLKGLFRDESEEVRRAAARCWHALEPDDVAKRGALLGAFIASIDLDADVEPLIHKLEESSERLPAEVCELAERVVEAYGTKGGDMRLREAAVAHNLSPLVLRLHEKTDDTDTELRRRVLDVIDKMLRLGFMGIDKGLEERHAR